jgi:transcriptional regulator with XRE-family HTH domain
MSLFTSNKTRLRYAANRVKRMRESLKLTKAELARRAQLTPSEYLRIEPPKPTNRWRRGPAVVMVPTKHLEQLAIALGTSVDYIATGKTDATALPPNHPTRAMHAEMTRERRQHERLREKYERLLEQRTNERDTAQQFVDASVAQRADDVDYLRSLLDGLHRTEALRAALDRMEDGAHARPTAEEIAAGKAWCNRCEDYVGDTDEKHLAHLRERA